MKTILISNLLLKTPEHDVDKLLNAIKVLQQEYEMYISYSSSIETENKKNIEDLLKKNKLKLKIVYIHEFTEYLNNIKADEEKTYFLFDHPDEIKSVSKNIIKCIYILTNKGMSLIEELLPEIPVYHDFGDAVDSIMTNNINEVYCDVDAGAENLKNGDLVAFPTETVYGLGGDVFNQLAIENIFKLKNRPFFNPLIAHVSDLEMLKRLTLPLGEKAIKLIDKFWPGPLTLVIEKHNDVPDIVTGGNPTVAVRMPSHPVALDLIRKAETPIAAPSANSFGKTSPTTAKHVIEQLGSRGYRIIDGGACRVGVESTVLSVTNNKAVLLRPGGLSVEAIENVIGPIDKNLRTPVLKNLESPGMLASHYAPATPLILKRGTPQDDHDPKHGHIIFNQNYVKNEGPTEFLSLDGSMDEASTNLYAAMFRLDKLNLDKIIAWKLPEHGLGLALNDRLKKASVNN